MLLLLRRHQALESLFKPCSSFFLAVVIGRDGLTLMLGRRYVCLQGFSLEGSAVVTAGDELLTFIRMIERLIRHGILLLPVLRVENLSLVGEDEAHVLGLDIRSEGTLASLHLSHLSL